MSVSGNARRRRENFQDLGLKIIKNIKKIDENDTQIPKIFSAPSEPDLVLIGGGWKLNYGVS